MLNSNKDNVNKEREFNFAKRLREILKGDYNDEFIAAGHLPAAKTKGTPLTNQEVIDIIKAITNKESGSKQSITDWLGSTTPKMEYIIKLAEFFGASIDWMIGLTDNRTPEKQDEETLFRKLGISRESWQALTQNRKLLTHNI